MSVSSRPGIKFFLSLSFIALGCARTAPPPAQVSQPMAVPKPAEPTAPVANAKAPEPDAPPADPSRGWLGVELGKRAPGDSGVIVLDVLRNSPAARSGLMKDDVLLSVDGQNVNVPEDVARFVGEKHAGQRASIVLSRAGTIRLIAVSLEPFPSSDGMMRMAYVGAPAPQLEALKTVQGSLSPSLGALRGRVVVMEFWASWCMVCQMALPVLNGLHERYAAQGVTVVGVTPDPVDLASRAAYEHGMSFPVFSDDTGATSRSYRANVVPTVFVIDKKGEVRDVVVGYSSERLAKVETLVKRLVMEH